MSPHPAPSASIASHRPAQSIGWSLVGVAFMVAGWLGAICLAGCSTSDSAVAPASAPLPADGPGIAVVELFTSEGCSSCPPADHLLAGLVADAKRDGLKVFPIAFHVDYWNRLGWVDRFSLPAFTARQRAYAESMKLDSVYTPQMVVNGETEFVGSDAARAHDAIAAALKTAPKAAITLKAAADKSNPRLIHAHFKVDFADGGPAEALLQVVAVESGLQTKVERGENAGKGLAHENVARALASSPVTAEKASADVDLTLPEDADPSKVTIVAYLQVKPAGAIVAAAAAQAK